MTDNKEIEVEQLTNKIIEQENTIKKLKKELEIATSVNAYYEKKEDNYNYDIRYGHYDENSMSNQMKRNMYEPYHSNSSHL